MIFYIFYSTIKFTLSLENIKFNFKLKILKVVKFQNQIEPFSSGHYF
jgi:hypothetical protein